MVGQAGREGGGSPSRSPTPDVAQRVKGSWRNVPTRRLNGFVDLATKREGSLVRGQLRHSGPAAIEAS